MKTPFDVAIVGLGPTGATLACLLGAQGIDVCVLEREARIHLLPRAIFLDGEAMRILQTAGVGERLSQESILSPGVRYVGADGDVLHERRRPDVEGPQGWRLGYRFHQPRLEALLREALADLPSVQVQVQREVVDLCPLEDGVRLRSRDPQGRETEVTARFVVGCDGARSLLRRRIGGPIDDLGSDERWLVVDLLLKRPRPDLGDLGIQYCDPRRPATYIRGVGHRRRWELMLGPDEDADEMVRPARLWSLLSRWIGPEDADIERPAVYTFHALVASRWREGRCLLAGDAAHQTPPFLGQGLCAGLRDAANMAWKLVAVLRQGADPALLDTYARERIPHARALIEAAVRHGSVIQTTDPAIARQRDRDLRDRPEVFDVPQPRLGPGLYDDEPHCGFIGRQPRLADGRRLDDAVGHRHALLLRPQLAPSAPACPRLAVVDDAGVQPWLDEWNAAAALLRPDRYVAGVAKSAAEWPAMLARHLDPAGVPRSRVDARGPTLTDREKTI
jgi:3-(3-hydroxy-phenyl)propionate hydroxylase